MDWARDGAGWPNRDTSRFVDHGPHLWHVQEAGQGETLVLLHGAGGATQSWRTLLPLLAEHFHVVAPDLPGQGFTRMRTRLRCGLRPMAEDLAGLCASEGWSPRTIVGHSAGAALGLEMADATGARQVIGLNAALGMFEGVAGWLFPLMAKFMSINPVVPPLLARMAGSPARAAELLTSTGSQISPEGIALYHRLMTDSGHIDGTLAMMAQWDIGRLLSRLERIDVPVMLIAGTRDGTVAPDVSRTAAERLPNARFVPVEGAGHLMHEDRAELVCDLILQATRSLEAQAV